MDEIKTCMHVIPVGGQEPSHCCHSNCWCWPFINEHGIKVHNAKDLREARERHGKQRPDELWVLVKEML